MKKRELLLRRRMHILQMKNYLLRFIDIFVVFLTHLLQLPKITYLRMAQIPSFFLGQFVLLFRHHSVSFPIFTSLLYHWPQGHGCYRLISFVVHVRFKRAPGH